jgi:hypothetical protein
LKEFNYELTGLFDGSISQEAAENQEVGTRLVPRGRSRFLELLANLMREVDESLFEEGPPLEGLIDELFALGAQEGERAKEIVGEIVGAISDLQLEANSGDREARRTIAELKAWIDERIEDESVEAPKLVILGQAFSHAGFDPGPVFKEVTIQRMRRHAPDGGAPVDPHAMLDELVANTDEDPIVLFEAVSEVMHYMPDDNRDAMITVLASSDRSALQEAALGFLLARDKKIATLACEGMVASATHPAISGRFLDRLVRLRGLVSVDRQASVDAVIDAVRLRALPFQPAPARKLTALIAAPPDGAGAQAVFGLLGQRGDTIFVSVLFKFEQGIVDVGIVEGMSKRELNAMAEQFGMLQVSVTTDFMVRRLSAALVANQTSGREVPLSILQVMEHLRIPTLCADRLQPDAVFDGIIGISHVDISSFDDLQTAFNITAEAEVDDSWFESNDEVDALLRKIRSRKKRIEALLTQYLPRRRQFWIEQCAWTALILVEKPPKKGELALSVALLGKHLCSGRALTENPLMRAIAEKTIDSFALQ